MIRKLIIIAVLVAIAYGVFKYADNSDFFGLRKQKRQTLEDFQRKAGGE
jgi:hypothetical protein